MKPYFCATIPEFEFNQEESPIREQQKLLELFNYRHGLNGGFGVSSFALLMFICLFLLCVSSVETCKGRRRGGGVAWLMPEEKGKREVEEDDDDSSELHDLVAHLGEGGTRERSKVQSLASLMRKRKTRWRKKVSGGGGSGSGSSSSLGKDKLIFMVHNASSPLCYTLEWRFQSPFLLLHYAAIDLQEAKDSIDEEDPRPTSSTWSYVTHRLAILSHSSRSKASRRCFDDAKGTRFSNFIQSKKSKIYDQVNL
ncbi:hypothetical protein HKD37_04G010539 [Glycine soja]